MFDPELLEAFTFGFFGYGNLHAPIWFIGKEEAGAESLAEAEKRITVWAQRGKPIFDDVAEYHRAIGDTSRFDEGPKLQKTWAGLIRVALSNQGGANFTASQIIDYQSQLLARRDGRELLAELLPLPSPSTANWFYKEYSALPWLKSRTTYHKHILARRISTFRKLIADHNPKAVVFYSTHKWYVQQWESIAQLAFVKIEPNLWAAENLGTRFMIMEHPANQKKGINATYFERVGQLLVS